METNGTMSFADAADAGLVKLLITDASGQYIPQEFVRDFVLMQPGLGDDLSICLSGPDNDEYWDAWTNILDNGTIDGGKLGVWSLYQDGDLWAIKLGSDIDFEIE